MTTATKEATGHDELDTTGQAPFRDGVTIGLFTVIAGALGVMAAYGELFVDALVFLVVFTGLGVAAARSRSRKLRWVIAVLLVLFVGINLVFAIGDLSHPESPAPFAATAVVIVGGLVAIALTVLAALGRPARGTRVWPVAYGVLVVLGIGGMISAANVEDEPAQPGDTEIVAADFEFPETVELDAGATGIALRNGDRGRHTFVVEGEVPAVEMPAGSQVRVEVDLAAGEYRYFCDIAGHEDMEGTLVVR